MVAFVVVVVFAAVVDEVVEAEAVDEGINGIGEAKTRKYGELFLGALGQPAEKNPVPQ